MRSLWAFVAVGILCSFTAALAADIVVPIKPYAHAFKNPMKGFMGGQEYGTVTKKYIPWNALEASATDGIDKIIAYSNQNWAGYENTNFKVVPRIYLDYPGRPTGSPSDFPSDVESSEGLARVEKFVAKLGKAWNSDPRVAWIQVGIFGSWGESDYWGNPPPEPVLTRATTAFNAAFPNKLITARNYWTGGGSTYGVYWDSWGCPGQASRYRQSDGSIGDRWKTPAVMEGEVSYDYCPPAHSSATEDMQDSAAVDRICEVARWWHSTGATWISGYQVGPATARGAERFQMTNGYRLVIDTVRYTGQVAPGGTLNVSFGVTNTGAAQFLYPWPVEVSLCNPTTKQPVWKGTFANLDIRNWLPGDKCDYDAVNAQYKTHNYLVPPVKYQAAGTFTLPSSLPSGEYALALAILDPAGMLPCARFAIANYWNGGRHPIGKIGVGMSVANPMLDESQFNDLKADNSLHYVLNYTPTATHGPRTRESPLGAIVCTQSRNGLDIVVPAAPAASIRVMTVSGKLVAQTRGHTLKLDRRISGTYLVQAARAQGTSGQRIIIR
jgi:hypothetical protein